MNKQFIMIMVGILMFGGIVYATTTITNNGIDTSGNLTSVHRYNGEQMRLSGEDTFIRLVGTQAGERTKMQWYNGSQIMLSIECHGINDPVHNATGDPETHCGFYASNSTGSSNKILNLQWGHDRNNITFENGAYGKAGIDFNDVPIYNANFTDNITMRSPDGTLYSCGVNNGGTFVCG